MPQLTNHSAHLGTPAGIAIKEADALGGSLRMSQISYLSKAAYPHPMILRVKLYAEAKTGRDKDFHLVDGVAQDDALVRCQFLWPEAFHG